MRKITDLLFPRTINHTMITSPIGVSLIKKWESLKLKSYKPIESDRWTIGYGTTVIDGVAVLPGMTITQDQAESYLRSDLRVFEDAIKQYVSVPLNSNQFDALVSFTYNVGSGNLYKSTLLKKINESKFDECPKEFKRWIRSGGKIYIGLINRRNEESWLFEQPAGSSESDIRRNLKI